MLDKWFGEKTEIKEVEKSQNNLIGVESGLSLDAVNLALTTGQTHQNIAQTFGDPVPNVPMLKEQRAFTKQEASKIKEVATQLTEMATATDQAMDDVVKINQAKVQIAKANHKGFRSNLTTTTALQGINVVTANLAESQRLNHVNNGLNYQSHRANIDAQVSGKLSGYGF